MILKKLTNTDFRHVFEQWQPQTDYVQHDKIIVFFLKIKYSFDSTSADLYEKTSYHDYGSAYR